MIASTQERLTVPAISSLAEAEHWLICESIGGDRIYSRAIRNARRLRSKVGPGALAWIREVAQSDTKKASWAQLILGELEREGLVSPVDPGAKCRARGDEYLATNRNRDLPETVRRWIGEGEGAGQDCVLAIHVGAWEERSSFDVFAAPCCDCCGSALSEGWHPVRVVLAESTTCPRFDEKLKNCAECSEDWVLASEKLTEKGASVRSIGSVKQALVHLTTARCQMLDTDDAIIREHVEAAIALLDDSFDDLVGVA